MITKNKVMIMLVLLAVAAASIPTAFAFPSEPRGISAAYDFSDIAKTWKSIPDTELNDYIGNNDDPEIYEFIAGLTESERQMLLSKDTMLNNEVSIDDGNGKLRKMRYYDRIMEKGSTPEPMMLSARNVVSTFTKKSGHCFYRFVDNNSGYIVRYKVTFTLNSTANAESLTNGYTLESVIYATGGENTNNTGLDKVTFEKKMTYMQKANTIHKELSDGTAGELQDGSRIYPTAITPIFVLTVKVPKPANTYGEWNTENFSINGVDQKLAKGSRFNFKTYNWQNDKDSTFDNKVYHKEVTDTMTSCVNILSCGFTVENTGSLELAEGVPEVDTINVVYKHPKLNLNFYVNGGTVKTGPNNINAVNPVERSVLYDFAFNSTYGLPHASNLGFSRAGYTPKAGAEWKNIDGTLTWDEAKLTYTATDLKDYTDGVYFLYNVRDMYVNWEANVYEVILNNQGADYSGTEKTWYRYNTYKTVTLDDGTTQNNYFYTSQALKTALNKGYKIDKPKKAGYVFKGYFTEKNGKGTQYVNASGSFINKLWKIIGPHTLYAYWEKEKEKTGTLTIKRNFNVGDYYNSHGDATFLFRITSTDDVSRVYYRMVAFDESDLDHAADNVITGETDCVLPYGNYTVESLGVYRYGNILDSISDGTKMSQVKGAFQLNDNCNEVIAVYSGRKSNWAKFSHNDVIINAF